MRRLKHSLLVTIAVPLISLAAYLLGGWPVVATLQSTAPAATGARSAATQAAPTVPLVVEGAVVPVQRVALSAPLSGIAVAEVLVREGDTVAPGDPLLRLDTRDLELEVAEARAALKRAQAGYDQLAVGAAPEEIAAAEARLEEARARLQQAQGQVTSADVAAARARLEQARVRLREVQNGPIPAAVDRAQADVDQAQALLEQRRAELSAAKEEARRLMEERANDLRAAQATYAWASEERRRNDGDDAQGRAAAEALARAELAMSSAESVLERAKVEYEARRQDEIAGLAAAEAQLAAAQANLNLQLQGARPDELASARAAVAAAEADLARLSSGERAGELEAANAVVAQVQAELEGLVAGPDAAALALALATVEESKVRLQQAELRLAQATLTAPLAGTVAVVEIKPGETPNGRNALLVLADTTAWRIEAQKLTDFDMVRIHEGDAVTISAYAIPELQLSGRVERIQPPGRNEQGQARYTAVIVPDEWDERLRWGMSVQVTLVP